MQLFSLLLLVLSTNPFVNAAPSNDKCSHAQPLVCGSYVRGNTKDATQSDSCNPQGPDVWYSLTLEKPSTVTLSVCKYCTFDAYLLLMHNCTDSTCLAQDDDYCGSGPAIFTHLQPGHYHIAVSGFNGESGDFQLDVDCADYEHAAQEQAVGVPMEGTESPEYGIMDRCGMHPWRLAFLSGLVMVQAALVVLYWNYCAHKKGASQAPEKEQPVLLACVIPV